MDPLEQRAITLLRRYRTWLPADVKSFFRDLAERLGWHDLAREVGK